MAKRARQEENTKVESLVKINAGGKIYYTTEKTLTGNFPDSMIARLFTHKEMITRDDEGVYFLDVDPTLFGAMLNVMRRPSLVEVVPVGVAEETWWYELDYWGIREYSEMTVELKEVVEKGESPASLVVKLQQMEEKRAFMKKQICTTNLLILDTLLTCFGFKELMSATGPVITNYAYLKEDVLYLNTATREIGPKSTNKSHYCLCLTAYIWHYRDTFRELLKDMAKFTKVTIDRRVPHTAYTFQGKVYQPEKNKEALYIAAENDYGL